MFLVARTNNLIGAGVAPTSQREVRAGGLKMITKQDLVGTGEAGAENRRWRTTEAGTGVAGQALLPRKLKVGTGWVAVGRQIRTQVYIVYSLLGIYMNKFNCEETNFVFTFKY